MIDLMIPPIVAGLVILSIHAYLGLHVIARGVIFVDLAFAQIAALGATVGFLVGVEHGTPLALAFSMGFTLVGALIFSYSRLEKTVVPQDDVESRVPQLLDQIQRQLLELARERRDAATFDVSDYDEFKARLADPGGFLRAHWCGDSACEERVQAETKATIRLLAFDQPEEAGACLVCGGASSRRAHFARAY